MDIATAFFEDVPQDPKDPRMKAKMDKANEVLEKLISGGGVNHPTFKVVKLEPIPQSSLREMRWRIRPISNDVQANYVAKQMTEQVFPHVITAVGGGKGVHYAVWDRGQAAGVVKVEAIPVAAGLGEELMKVLRDNNEGRFNGRWTGERPPIQVSLNTRTGTGNVKLEVFSWEIAEEMVNNNRISNKNTSGTTTWWISTATPSPTSLKPGLYSGQHHEQTLLLFLHFTRLFFFFFFLSVLAYGLDHGEAPGPRKGPLCQDGQPTN